MIELLSPANNASISTLTDVQKDFIRNRSFEKLRANDEELVDWLGLKQNMAGENSHPLPVEFKWMSDDKSRVNFVLQIATDNSFKHIVRQIFVRKQEASVFNLENGQQYFWRVFIEDTPHDNAEVRSFRTVMETPRWIFIDGCTNVRDCGGWMTSSGRRIRQSLLYRGSEFNRHHAITPTGRYALVHDLHLKTDIDIRGKTEIFSHFVPPLDENGIKWIKGSYIDFLRLWKPRYADFEISDDAPCGLSIETKGTWLNTSMYEIPTLAIVNEVFFKMRHDYDALLKSFEQRLDEKIKWLSDGTYHIGTFSEFGLRRRLSGEAQEMA
ncbi:MAG: tyrosine-protein phosphatase, partial [Victivallales bacterium]|nr:tyrosine-protein phosphatase [Victivallales bacterium]